MGSKKHTVDVVVHDMIERTYFYSIIFSQKEMGSEKHTADVVVLGRTMSVSALTGLFPHLLFSHHLAICTTML